MAEQSGNVTGDYIVHHLTNLKLDLKTMQIDSQAEGFWVLHLDTFGWSVVLGLLVLVMFRSVARKVESGRPSRWQNFIEMMVEFVDGTVKDAFHHKSRFVAPMALTVFFWVFLMNFMDLVPIDLLPALFHAGGVEYMKVVPSTDPNITIGMSLTVFLIATAGGVAVGAVLADRTDRHDLIAICGMACAAVLVLPVAMGLTPGMLIIVVLGAAGIASGMTTPSRDMLVRAATPEGASGRVFGFVYSGLDLGSTAMPVCVGWLMDHGRPDGVFYAVTALLFCTMGTVLLVRSSARRPSVATSRA